MLTNIRFTQNFLHDPALVSKIVSLSRIQEGDTVLEVGPGKGIITRELLRTVGRSGKVIAVELDENLAKNLKSEFQAVSQLQLVHQDILRFDLAQLGKRYQIFSNIPFAISARILEQLFIPETGPETAHLILQTDTLQDTRFGRKPLPTLKSLLIEPFYQIELAHRFIRSDFTPQPSVDTSLFSFTKREQPLVQPSHADLYKDFLATVSQDRVGEGAWKKIFLSRELQQALKESGLQKGKGLKGQTLESFISLFLTHIVPFPQRQQRIRGSFQQLKKRQLATQEKNEQEDHKPQR